LTKNIDLHRDTVKRVDDLEARKSCNALGVSKNVNNITR
jgi:hypothetical protein